MGTIFKLAFRNLWRNKRRTLITIASVMFAAFFSITLSSIRKGIWVNTLDGMLHSYTGHIQIHAKDYWENQSIDLLIPESRLLTEKIQAINQVDQIMERLENFCLLSTGDKTKGILMAGVDPEEAGKFTEISLRLLRGEWIQPEEKGTIIGKELANKTNLAIGDTLIAISQGYHGNNAAGQFFVKGIADFGNPEFNSQLVYIPLDVAREFYAAPGMSSALVITLKDMDDISSVKRELSDLTDHEQYEIMDYRELLPSMIEAEALDEVSARIILYILYILIGFGILGTVMMMVRERRYEFGVLKAIGMRSAQLFRMIFIETLTIGALGVVAGILLSYPIIRYFQNSPLHLSDKYQETYERFNMQPELTAIVRPDIFLEQAIVIFVLVSLISLYPYFTLKNLNPVQAMRP